MRGKNLFGLTLAIALLASLLAISPIVAAPTLPRMYLTPSAVTADLAEIITLDVFIENVNNLYAWEFKVQINVYHLTFLQPPKEGPFLKSGGFPTFFAWNYNPQSGILLVGCTRLGVVPGVSGTGKIATVRFIADTPGVTTHVDLYDDKKYDTNLNPIVPQGEPGDCTVTIQWPPELWNAELWLSSAKGGKVWSAWQVADLEPNPVADPTYWDTHPYFWNQPMQWPAQIVYTRMRNTGTVPVRVRTVIRLTDTLTGWTETAPSDARWLEAGGQVVCETQAGLLDIYMWLWFPGVYAWMQQYGATWKCTARAQFTLDGLTWYYWDEVIPALPGDGISKETPGGDSGKFKVAEPANMAPWNYDGYVAGQVNGTTGPIAGATVTIAGDSTTTDENGEYMLTIPNPPDPYFTWVSTDVTVDVSAAGYQSDSAVVSVDAGWTTTVDFVLVAEP